MKKRINIILGIIILILAAILVYMLIMRQGNSSEPIDNTTPIETSTPEPTPEPTEAHHEHVYTEVITTEATCTTDGLKTLTCECGDTYTEPITATGHVFSNYVYNNDATYTADGTETGTCECGLTDIRTAENSKLEYTFTYIERTMYAQQTVNVRDMPCEDGEKIGSLSTNDEVWVVRQCNETGWYEINNSDISGYVSDSYLGTSKVSTSNSGGGNSSGGGTDLNLTPGMGGDGGPLTGDTVIGDGTSHNNSSNNGNAFDGWGNNEGNDGGEIVGDAIIGDGTSHNNNSGGFDFGAAGDANASQSDGGDIVTDGTLNP